MYGRDGDLNKLNRDRNDARLPSIVRKRADEALHKITNQMSDKKLMGLRLQLINAVTSKDMESAHKIQQQMRAHAGEDRETGQ